MVVVTTVVMSGEAHGMMFVEGRVLTGVDDEAGVPVGSLMKPVYVLALEPSPRLGCCHLSVSCC